MAFRRNLSELKISLDPTPSGDEEYRDWLSQDALTPPAWDPDKARTRIDAIARSLAIVWTTFLIYIIVAQGNHDGTTLKILSYNIQILPKFHLESGEFIAVVTTTTASTFGFLVIVASHLFKRDQSSG